MREIVWTRHLLHPKWKELEKICSQIEKLKTKSSNLRQQINEDLEKYSDDELRKLKNG